MNLEETIKIMQRLKMIYPNKMNRYSHDEKRILLELWNTQFKEDTYKDVDKALHTYIQSEEGKYFPDIYSIREILSAVATTNESLCSSSFEDLKEINGVYHYGDKFNESYDWKNDPLNISKKSVYDFSLNDEETEAERQRLLKKAMQWQEELRIQYGN